MTMTEKDVLVVRDDRLQLFTAALALTSYPHQEKAQRGTGTHLYARSAGKQLADLAGHPFVTIAQALLDRGAPMQALFGVVCQSDLQTGQVADPPDWLPPDWGPAFRDFSAAPILTGFASREQAAWARAFDEAERVLAGKPIKPFLEAFVGPFPDALMCFPNISYPTTQEIGLRLSSALVCIVPPRIAWGESPPWPFDDDPAHLYRAVIATIGQILMMDFLTVHAAEISLEGQKPLPLTESFLRQKPTWAEQFTTLFVISAVAMFLEDHISRAEADAYVLMERRVSGLEVLPAAISVYRRYMREVAEGSYTTLLDFIPLFSRQLRIAHRVGRL